MRVNISLSVDLLERTKTWLDGRPLSGLIADLLIGYLDANEPLHGKKSPKEFKYILPPKNKIKKIKDVIPVTTNASSLPPIIKKKPNVDDYF